MQPTFRTDLTCSREEQQGVVFYRIDDPETRTSFRLYEIEYLIAQKLNGKRSIPDVIEAVKAEYNFDISEADLQKFISQLESMGFVRGIAGASVTVDTVTGVQAPTSAQEPTQRTVAPRRTEQTIDVVPPAESAVNEAELNRLLKSAFLHIRQGYVVHARDYLLAAREHSPADTRIMKVVSHVEVMADDAQRSEVASLWAEVQELFPTLAGNLGAITEERGPSIAQAARRTTEAWDADLRVRIRWSLLVIVLLVIGVGGFYALALKLKVFEAPSKVRVATMQSARVPVFYPGAATVIHPVQEAWLSFGASGKVGPGLPKPGTRVQEGQIVAALDIPAKTALQLKAARDGIKKTELDYNKLAKKLEKLLTDREAVETERADAEKTMKELRPKTVLKPDPATRKALDAAKKALDVANKKLNLIAKKERLPRAAEAKGKAKLELAKKKVELLEAKLGSKILRAPFNGEVTEVKVAVGQAAVASAPALHLRNPLLARLVFNVKEVANMQPGGEALVSVKGGNPIGAKIFSIKAVRGGNEVEVDMVDPVGSFLSVPPDSFRLVREFADPAFRLRAKALLPGDNTLSRILLLQGDRVATYAVEVIDRSAGDAWIRDPNNNLRGTPQVVVDRTDGQPLTALTDDTKVQVEGR